MDHEKSLINNGDGHQHGPSTYYGPGATTRRRESEVSARCVLGFQLLLSMLLWLLGLPMWLRLLMLLVPLWRNCCLLLLSLFWSLVA